MGRKKQEDILRICVIHRYPIENAISTNPSLLYFLNELSSKGHKIIYLSYRGSKTNESLQRQEKNIDLEYLPFTLDRKNNFDKYFKSLLFICLSPFVAYKIKRRKIDLIYCDDSLPFYGYLVKRFTQVPTVIRLGDLQTGYLFLQKTKLWEIFFKVVHKFELYVWKKMDGLIPISKPFERYATLKGINCEKIVTVSECVDTDIFKPKKPEIDIRKRYSLSEDDIILMYHGVVEALKGLDVLFNMIAKILKQNKNVKFFILGSGSSLPKLKILAKNLGIYNSIVWTGWIPFYQIVDYINSCDIGIPMRSNNFANNFVVTSALLQYWACSKPIIAPKLEAIEEIVREGENGYTFDFNNLNEFEENLRKPMKNKKLRIELGRNGRETIKRFRSVLIGKELTKAIEYFQRQCVESKKRKT